MTKIIVLSIIASFLSAGCMAQTSNGPGKPKKSATEKRIKKQQKHRKKHECPQLDC